MKIAYLGAIPFSDLEIPLIKAFQEKKCDVSFYFYIGGREVHGGCIDIDKVKEVDNILKASIYSEFSMFDKYVCLDNIYIINNYHNQRWHWKSWWIWLKFIKHLKSTKVDIIHIVWPMYDQRYLLYLSGIPTVMTVHDPLPHSGQVSRKREMARYLSFQYSKSLILLSKVYLEEFCRKYKIPKEKVCISKLGSYDCINLFHDDTKPIHGRYILYFGQIQSHKGIEFLLESMLSVHESIPELKCVIAGKGNFYFDISKYEKLDYIEIRNYYVRTNELASLLKWCEFAVVPYRDATQSGVVQTAFSAGVPLIATNVGSLPEAVRHEETGLIVQAGNVEDMSNAIIRLANDKKLLDQLKSNINNKWKPDMSWGKIADQFIHVYNSLKR